MFLIFIRRVAGIQRLAKLIVLLLSCRFSFSSVSVPKIIKHLSWWCELLKTSAWVMLLWQEAQSGMRSSDSAPTGHQKSLLVLDSQSKQLSFYRFGGAVLSLCEGQGWHWQPPWWRLCPEGSADSKCSLQFKAKLVVALRGNKNIWQSSPLSSFFKNFVI